MAVRRPPIRMPKRPLLGAVLLGLLSCHYDGTVAPQGSLVASVVVTAPRRSLAPGDTIQLTAQVMDSNGRVLPTEPVTWSSSTPAVAAVDANGRVVADSVGATTITATAAGQAGHTDLTVQVTVLCDCTEILDSTAVRLVSRNDSTGIYVFQVVRGPPPTADSGTILVGAGSGGYLRRVLHSALVGDLLTVETAPAYLEEAIRDGEVSVTQATSAPGSSPAPGRAWFGPWRTTYVAPGVTQMAGACCSISLNGFHLPIPIKKIKTKYGTLKLKGQVTVDTGEINFVPPLSIGAKIKNFQLESFHTTVGAGLGLDLHPYELAVIVGDSLAPSDSTKTDTTRIDSIPRDTLPDDTIPLDSIPNDSLPGDSTPRESKRLLMAEQPFEFFIGPVPVVGVVTERLTFRAAVVANASVRFKGTFNAGFGVTAGVQWTQAHGWEPVSSATSHFDATAPKLAGIEGSAAVRLSVVPEISVIFYEAAGPFINLQPYAQATAAADATFTGRQFTGFDWNTDIDFGIDLGLGAKLSLFGRKDLASITFKTIHLLKPRALIRDFSVGPLTVRTAATGQDIPDSFWVRLRPAFHDTPPLSGIRSISSSSQSGPIASTDGGGVLLDDVRSGFAHPHQLALDSIPGNCYSSSPNPDTVAIGSGLFNALGHHATDTLFTVACIPLGHLLVRTAPKGPDIAARYNVTLHRLDTCCQPGKADQPLDIGIPGGPTSPDTVIDRLIPVFSRSGSNGRLAVTLAPGRRNCATARPDTGVVIIQSGDTVNTQFLIRCVALGNVALVASTTDPDPPPPPDSLQYVPEIVPRDQIDSVPAQLRTLHADDSSLVGGLVPLYNASGAPGAYTVKLNGAPNRCTAIGGFTRAVTVLPGDTAITRFSVRCIERLQVITTTTGPGIDPDGYRVIVDNADGAGAADTVPAGLNDSLGIAGVTPGPHLLTLGGVDPTCNAPAPVDTVEVSGSDLTLARFAVTCPAPAPPSGLDTTLVDSTRVVLAWSPPAGSVVARYRIYRDALLHDSSATLTFTDVGLSPFTRYAYQVSSVDPSGLEGVRTGPLVVRTRDATPPPAPVGLTAAATSASRIALTWRAASDPETGVSGYVVYRDGAAIDAVRDTTFADTGLTGATTYTYEVSAFNGDSLEGPRSAPASATTRDATPPPAPPELGATAGSASEIDLSWAAVSDPESGIQGYRVYRDGAFVATASGTSFPDVGLEANTAYTYTVTAVNGAGLEGPPSPSATATTLADETPPPAPTGLTAIAVSSTRIDLQWSAVTDPESGIRTYRVYRDGSLVDSSTTTTLADSGLVPGGTYTYEVAAVNGAGMEGARSDPASATTPSDQDGDLVVFISTSGTNVPAQFTVEVNKDAFLQTKPVAPTGWVSFNGLVPQQYHVRLQQLPTNCTVQDSNRRDLTVVAGTSVQTTFVVTCQ